LRARRNGGGSTGVDGRASQKNRCCCCKALPQRELSVMKLLRV
jgi:hypothetical protein